MFYPNEGRAEKETARVEAFSDGVFAIAITLLVLHLIEMPLAGHDRLIPVLAHEWERFLAFAIGFCTILVCWINHRHVFDYVRRCDSGLYWANGYLLFLVTFIPFPTALLAQYIRTETTVAIALFGFGYFLIATAYFLLWSYVSRRELIDAVGDRAYYTGITMTYGAASVYTVFALGVCFVSTVAAGILYALMFGVFAFPKQFATKLADYRKVRAIR